MLSLHYMVIMNLKLCGILVLVSWIISVLHSFLQSLMTLRLSFCRQLKIPHYFCELKQLIQLAYSDKLVNNMTMNFAAGLLGGVPLAGII